MLKKKNKGFTLVEVLICVGIIGIIAAITIPTLLASTSEKALEAQRKALHSRMSQAFAQIKNLKSFELSANDSALEFITSGLSKVYKLTAICTAADLSECGITTSVSDFYNDSLPAYEFNLATADNLYSLNSFMTTSSFWGDINTNVAGFKTANGESVLLYYNPKCKSKKETKHKLAESVCINMIYDLNGSKTPNSYGEDIGYITVFYPSDPSVVSPILYNKQKFSGSFSDMLSKASAEGLAAPTIEELTSILINKDLTKISSDINSSDIFWSSTYTSEDTTSAWMADIVNGADTDSISETHNYFLIKK